jgi:ceramide glucosyltransferase
MSFSGGVLSLFVAVALAPICVVLIIQAWKIRSAVRHRSYDEASVTRIPVEILVPVKGSLPYHKPVLRSLLEQRYEPYAVTFIVESADDPANRVVDELCAQYPIGRKLVSGLANCCAQKNHNLVEASKSLRPEAEILVFCDSTNLAEPDWLLGFTAPLRAGEAQVVTTFRAFDPRPETIAGMCQAVYAACIVVLNSIKSSPWGGATGIRRKTFETLKVADVWSRTVVDDLVLGNILREARVEVRFDPRSLLTSPLEHQTFRGLLSYLDRQILFPKFTNPGIWVSSLVCSVILTVGLTLALSVAALYPPGYTGALPTWVSIACLGLIALAGMALRSLSPIRLSASRWLFSIVPLLIVGCFVFLRSIFVNRIDWHGTKYYPGSSGVVLRMGRSGHDRTCS